MKKKMLIELLVYVVLAITGIILLFTYKSKEIEIHIPSDFQVESMGGGADATVPFQ